MAKELKPKREVRLFEPWAPPPPESVGLREVAAIQGLFNGTATAEQQQKAMHFILVTVCGVDEDPFCPTEDGRRSTDYALGKRRVGLYLRSLRHAKLKNFKDPDAAPTEQG